MISPDDPRITAYADGALPPAQAERFERELAEHPDTLAEIERLRSLQRALREAFAEETAEDGVFAVAEADESPALSPRAIPRKRPYSVYRDSDDARAEAAGWRPLAPARGSRRDRWLAWLFPGWMAPVVGAACVLMLLIAVALPPTVRVRETARRSVDAANLRLIGQAALFFAGENRDECLPEASSVWDFARQLAIFVGLNAGNVWLSSADPAFDPDAVQSPVLTSDRKSLNTGFTVSRPAYAVPLAKIKIGDPVTTPIAWTRGLQADGTWAAHSPYGKQGGHVMFLDGRIYFYRNMRDQFVRYDGKGLTSNVLEALPPGARIGEYTPTANERATWATIYRPGPNDSLLTRARHSKLLMLGVTLLSIVSGGALVFYLLRRRPA